MRSTSIRSRTVLAAAAAVSLFLAACGGDDTTTPATEPPPESTLPPVEEVVNGYPHATGPDDVVIRIGFEGGFVTPEMAFQQLPALLVTGDGRVFQQGPVIAIFPGPLLPNVQVRTISPEGIQDLLALADQHGLLAERDYPSNDMIADAADTVVSITVDGVTYTHRAYALGFGEGPDGAESDEDRAELFGFVSGAIEYAVGPAGDVLGPEAAFEPDHYLIRALLVGDADPDPGFEPTVVDWPAESSYRLDDEVECARVAADAVRELFESANQLTWFAQDGITYQLAVKPQLPGDDC